MIFLDSSFIIACKVVDDQNHEKSMKHLSEFIEDDEEVIVSDYIFDEVVTVLLIKTKDLGIAVDTGNVLKSSARLLKLDDFTFNKTWDLFKNQDNTKLSFTDCSSLALMKKEGIKRLATFDEGFKKIKGIEVISD